MRRRLLILLTVVSVPMCVAVVALWVRSYWVRDVLTWEHNNIYTPFPQPPESAEGETSQPAPPEQDLELEEAPFFFHEQHRVVSAAGGIQICWERCELSGFAGSPWTPGFTHESIGSATTYPLHGRPVRPGTWLDGGALGFEVVMSEEGTRPPDPNFNGTWAAERSVTLPLWSLTLATALCPAWYAR
jgi:hypothetical protein